jgi:succinoglycan biosynthesis protein ExoM
VHRSRKTLEDAFLSRQLRLHYLRSLDDSKHVRALICEDTVVTPHITVCICTYKRPHILGHLLRQLDNQETRQQFTYSIVVVDNDYKRSAEPIIDAHLATARVPLRYCVEPRQNIALARNMAVQNAIGDFIAFIDDDQLPMPQWLFTLFSACYDGVAGVLGPVKPRFDVEPPRWVVKGRFCERPSYPTGFVIDWRKGRTGNVLLRRRLFEQEGQPFRPQFLTGEDQDFFRRMIDKGHIFTWCNDALALEIVPPTRWNRRFMLKRALLRGQVAPKHPTFGPTQIAKSVVAVPVYTVALPVALAVGQHVFMTLLVKLFDHLGKLLALLHITLVREPYVSE